MVGEQRGSGLPVTKSGPVLFYNHLTGHLTPRFPSDTCQANNGGLSIRISQLIPIQILTNNGNEPCRLQIAERETKPRERG